MDPLPTWKPTPVNIAIAIAMSPAAIGFLIAACISGGPREVFKSLSGRK